MKIPLEPDKYYHIYNHANGRENLFVNEGNYGFFLQKYSYHINPIADTYVADTYAYCLMPNHFHVAVKIKSVEAIRQQRLCQQLAKGRIYSDDFDVPKYLSKQFSNLFSSYSQAFNKQQKRRGSLFIPNFKRKLVDNKSYFKNLIHYIHFNPVHHKFVDDLRDWKHTSFDAFFSGKTTSLKRERVLSWFKDKEGFWEFHQKEIDPKMVEELEFY